MAAEQSPITSNNIRLRPLARGDAAATQKTAAGHPHPHAQGSVPVTPTQTHCTRELARPGRDSYHMRLLLPPAVNCGAGQRLWTSRDVVAPNAALDATPATD